jgi:hypothetical protein
MTLTEIACNYIEKKVPYPDPDPDKLQGQCVQFIRYCLKEFYKLPQWGALGLYGGAFLFWTNYETDPAINKYFEKILNTPDFIPKEGDIVIWNKNKGGGYGHIGIVYGFDHTINMFTCLEQNWKPLKTSITKHNYNDVLGFLRKRESV